jgi:hypothetical protein
MKINLVVLYVEYNKEKYKGSFKLLEASLNKIRYANITYIIIDNSNEGQHITLTKPNHYDIGGDNSNREFSGWQRGIDALRKLNIACHIVLFTNETFLVDGTSYLEKHASTFLLLKSLIFNSVIGSLNSHDENLTLLNYVIGSWIRTNCFFVPDDILDKLDTLCPINDNNINRFLEDSYPVQEKGNIFKRDAPISIRYRELLVEWLTQKWHSKFEINEKTYFFFKEKVKAILNEALLTARLREKKVLIMHYSITEYLYSHVRKCLSDSIARLRRV